MHVDDASLEEVLEPLRASVADPVAGLFGPGSLMWAYTRDTATFIGSWRASMLQLAHPWVAAAVRDFSKVQDDPVGRFHRTFQVVLRLIYGDLEQALAVARRLHRMHEGIAGEVGDGSSARYEANSLGALVWVHATLWETLVLVREELWGPIPLAEKEAFYEETVRFAALFGIPARALPADWSDFVAYNRDMWHSETLRVLPSAVRMSEYLFRVNRFPFVRPVCRMGRRFTRRVLPAPIREAYGLPATDRWNERLLAFDLWQMRLWHRRAPRLFTRNPVWTEARRRVDEGVRAPLRVRCMTRISLGTWELVGVSQE